MKTPVIVKEDAGTKVKGSAALALLLCVALLGACSGIGMHDRGVPGPSWQQLDARLVQQEVQEGDEPEERLREAGERAEQTARKAEKAFRVWAILLYGAAAVGLIAILTDDSESDLTFQPLRDQEEPSKADDSSLRYGGVVRY